MPPNKIQGGYYIWARQEEESWIAQAPPHVREVFRLLVRRANYRDHGRIRRGQCLITFKEIAEDLSWRSGYRKHKYTKTQIDNAFRSLRREEMITTTKSSRGMIVSVVNYEKYQDPDNYDTATTDHTTTATTVDHGGLHSDISKIDGDPESTVTTTVTTTGGHDKERKKRKKIKYIYEEKHFLMAVHLKETVLLRLNKHISETDVKNWANQIRLMESKDKLECKWIWEALRWYRDNWNLNKFIPVIESGKTFREKWGKLQNAMARNKSRGGTHHGFSEKDYGKDATDPGAIPEFLK